MKPMARIEVVLFLREIAFLRFCKAEDILSIAAIAREETFSPSETIYRENDPAHTLYCVIEGQVCLEKEDLQTVIIDPKESFGFLEILSDRLRYHTAVAGSEVRVLAIDADDFFDLLSNNIEIVKALFRQITEHGIHPIEGRNTP